MGDMADFCNEGHEGYEEVYTSRHPNWALEGRDLEWNDGGRTRTRSSGGRGSEKEFCTNHLWYHTSIPIEGIVRETEKAYLVVFRGKDQWLPKKLCREVKESSLYIWTRFFIEHLQEA